LVPSTPAGLSGPDIRWESRWLRNFPARLREGYDLFGAPAAAENFVHGMLRQNARHIKPIPHAPAATRSRTAACFRVGPVPAAASKRSSALGFWSGSIRPLTQNASFWLERGRDPNKRVKDRFVLPAGSDLADPASDLAEANPAARSTLKTFPTTWSRRARFCARARITPARHGVAFSTAECAR